MAPVINLDEFKSIWTHRITLYVNGYNRTAAYDAIYFYSFGVWHIPEGIKKFIGNKNIIPNIYRIQACNSTIYGYAYIRFIDFMLKGERLLDYRHLFSLNDYENNDKKILKYFQ